MQKIIGLDIGSYSVKVVEIINTFKSYEIANFYENVIPQIDELSPDIVIPACMEQLFTANNIEADRIVTAMPGQYISSRVLPFNFSDPRKIEAAIIPEIEDIVPYYLNDMIMDYQILGTMNDQTVALAVMTRKNFLATFLENLQRINIDPKFIDVDSLSFYNLTPYLAMEPGRCYAIVDVGHEKTSVCIVQDDMLKMFRSINLGGKYITEFLARDLEINFNEAQRLKHKVSQVLSAGQETSLTGDDLLVAERMTLASDAIVKELGRTFYAFKTWEKTPLSGIFLSGGTSCIKNFDNYLADNLSVEVIPNRLDQTDLIINADLSDKMYRMVQGISIGMRAITSVQQYSQINLRRGEFSYVQDYEAILKGASVVFKSIAVVLLLLCGLYAAQYFTYNKHVKELRTLYKRELVKVLPDLAKRYRKGNPSISRMRKDAQNSLKIKLLEEKKAIEDFYDSIGKSGALVSLEEISNALPKELKVDVVLYRYSFTESGQGRLVLRGETDTYDSSTAILEALKKVSVLSSVEEKESGYKPGTDQKVVEFTIQAKYQEAG